MHPKQLAHRPPPSPLRGSKKGVKGFLRGPSWTKRNCSCRSSRPFAALRGQKEVAVAVLRAPSRPFADKKKQLPLPFFAFFAPLRGPSRTKRSCRCRSSRPFAALRGQKEIAVAVLRGPSRPFADKKKLPLPLFAPLRGPSRTKRNCRCRSSRPFVEKPPINPEQPQFQSPYPRSPKNPPTTAHLS